MSQHFHNGDNSWRTRRQLHLDREQDCCLGGGVLRSTKGRRTLDELWTNFGRKFKAGPNSTSAPQTSAMDPLASLTTDSVAPATIPKEQWLAVNYMNHLRKLGYKAWSKNEHPTVIEIACEIAFISALPAFREELKLVVEPIQELKTLSHIAVYDRKRWEDMGTGDEIANEQDVQEWMDSM